MNPNVISFLNGGYWPHANSAASGDGLNTLGYVFSSPISLVQDWYIAKVDYNVTQDGKHRISVSGALANVSNPGAQFLPGQPPEDSLVNYNKGIIVGYTGVISNTIVNNFRYGYVRESVGQNGNSNQQWIILRGLNDQTGRHHPDPDSSNGPLTRFPTTFPGAMADIPSSLGEWLVWFAMRPPTSELPSAMASREFGVAGYRRDYDDAQLTAESYVCRPACR